MEALTRQVFAVCSVCQAGAGLCSAPPYTLNDSPAPARPGKSRGWPQSRGIASVDVDLRDDVVARRHAHVVSVIVAIPAIARAGIAQVDDPPVGHDIAVAPILLRPRLAGGPAG